MWNPVIYAKGGGENMPVAALLGRQKQMEC